MTKTQMPLCISRSEKRKEVQELTSIPGVGQSIAAALRNIGIKKVSDLRGKNPELLFERSNILTGALQDRCLLYVFRCAVYYAETPEQDCDSEKLKWWNWKDAVSKKMRLSSLKT
jgi:nucleotidyltransferase/DNA polymerase involved in DNA repair